MMCHIGNLNVLSNRCQLRRSRRSFCQNRADSVAVIHHDQLMYHFLDEEPRVEQDETRTELND